MKKKNLYIFSFCLIAAAAAVCIAVFTVMQLRYKEITQPERVDFSLSSSAYSAAVQSDFCSETLIASEFDGIYYSASPEQVKFYTVSDADKAEALQGVSEVEIELKLQRQTLGARVYYIEKDGRLFGIGIYLSKAEQRPVYPYALFRLSGTAENCLLLLSFDAQELYKSNRTYSEIYSYSFESGKAKKLVDENNRLVNINGAPRDDWSMITDSMLANGAGGYYFSSRNYSYDDGCCEIFPLSGKGAAVNDALGRWASVREGDLHFFKKSGDGFAYKRQLQNKKESGQLSFEGDFYEDYIVCGNVIFDKKNSEFSNLVTLETVKLAGIDASAAADFALNGDMTRCVIIFPERKQENSVTVQRVAFCSLDTGEVEIFEEPLIYNSAADFSFISDTAVIHSRLRDEKTDSYSTCVYRF